MVWPLKVSIVIPVFNEAATVRTLVEKVRRLELDKELIIVNDGSSDGTSEALSEYEGRPGITVHHSPVNLGKGSSVRIGFSLAKGEIITIQDADLELEPSDIYKLLEPIIRGEADVVYGSRFLGQGLIEGRKGQLSFYLANRALATLTNTLYGSRLTDIETCYKVFRREVLAQIKIEENRFGFEPEITMKCSKRKFRIYEVPISYHGRTYEEGKKIGWRAPRSTPFCDFEWLS